MKLLEPLPPNAAYQKARRGPLSAQMTGLVGKSRPGLWTHFVRLFEERERISHQFLAAQGCGHFQFDSKISYVCGLTVSHSFPLLSGSCI